MSWDLQVFTAGAVDLSGLVDGLVVDSGLAALSVLRQVRATGEVAFPGDGPLRVEREDLPQAVADAFVGVDTLYELAVPTGSAEAVRQLTRRFARRMAEQGDGAIYDLQSDRVLWPRTSRRVPEKGDAPERVTQRQLRVGLPGRGKRTGR